jgi:diguanylate cyclase
VEDGLAPFPPYGVHTALIRSLFELIGRGRYDDALALAEWADAVLGLLGDRQSRLIVGQGRMYALFPLGRVGEALEVGQALALERLLVGPRAAQAKTMADVAELFIAVGRIDDGLHWLARASGALERTPHSDLRYFSALCSVGDAARAADLYELADECARLAAESLADDEMLRAEGDLQHAEMLVEWGIRLQQVGQSQAGRERLGRGVAMMRDHLSRHPDRPRGRALLAVGLSRTGRSAEAVTLVEDDLLSARTAGSRHEARLLHLAFGSALQASGDPEGAYREFSAALELAELAGQRLLIGFELAVAAAARAPSGETRVMLAALREQLERLWRLRLDRLLALQQSRRRTELEDDRERVEGMAVRDALTGLANRRVFDERLAREQVGEVLILIDVDQFKTINDTYSHGVGDDVLRTVAQVLRAHCRTGEVAVRFGGDEFALFLDTDLPAASRVAERIRRVIAERNWDELAPGLRVTLSLGLARSSAGMTGQDLFDRADNRLYAAKSHGRNRLAA